MRIAAFGLLLLILTACSERGVVALSDAAPEVGTVRTVFMATNRAPVEGPTRFDFVRSPETSFGLYDISIPPVHESGQIEWPGRKTPDPARHFVTRSETRFTGAGPFSTALRDHLRARAPRDRDVVVFVHGYNNTFAEGLYRLAQMSHDLQMPGTVVSFGWPSVGNPLGYAYDRDSAIFSRDNLHDLLRVVSAAGARRITIVAHSMGSFLTMETLRQVHIANDTAVERKIEGVVLMSPDIDIEVFQSQARSIETLPQPFIVFTSRRDRALRLSALLTGRDTRLGNIGTAEDVADFEVTLVDVSQFRGDRLAHFTVGTSPALISLLNSLDAVDRAFQTGETGLLPGTVLTVRRATQVVLEPVVQTF
jgi:esterase/lipase superfamily enzyme